MAKRELLASIMTDEISKKVRVGSEIENPRPGDWVCPNCNDHNYSFREFCRKCFHTKDGEKKEMAEGKKPGDWHCQNCAHLNYLWRNECQRCQRKKPWNAQSSNTQGKNPNDWMCPNCGDHVFASRVACRKCNTPKMMAMRAMGMGMGNFGQNQNMQGRRPGDWNCPSCNDQQYAFRTECRKCGAAKPSGMNQMGNQMGMGMGMNHMGGMGMNHMGGMGMNPMGMNHMGGMGMNQMGNQMGFGGGGGQHGGTRPGDWRCPQCNDNQYAFRTECRKCNTAKPSGMSGGGMGGGGMGGGGMMMGRGGNQQRREGDWDCPQCGDMQYASRTVCRKCGTAKPTQ